MALTSALSALVRSNAVIRVAKAASFDFTTGKILFVSRNLPVTYNAEEYRPSGGFIGWTVSELAPGMVASKADVMLSGLPDASSAAYWTAMTTNPAVYRGRRVVLSLMFFNEFWQPVGLHAVWAGIMDSLSFSDGPNDAGRSRSLKLTCETPFATKNRVRLSLFTDSDQKARHPGDRFLEMNSVEQTRIIQGPVVV
jgi:hypothetical protein